MNIFNNSLVIVYVLQLLTFITLISTQNISSISSQLSTKSTITNHATTANSSAPINPAPNKNQQVVTEGGGKIEMPMKPSVNISQHNREHVIMTPPTISNSAILASSAPPMSSTSPKIQIHSSSSTNASIVPVTEQYKPIYENSVPNKTASTDHKKISARKGVNYTDFVEPKPKPKKPTVTVASDEPFAPSHFQSKSNSSANHAIPKVPNLDMISESNQGNTQKYVVPIVIVILSVPFIAILISFLYKRGAEWWKYRHYRRMDFLINGMYDN